MKLMMLCLIIVVEILLMGCSHQEQVTIYNLPNATEVAKAHRIPAGATNITELKGEWVTFRWHGKTYLCQGIQDVQMVMLEE